MIGARIREVRTARQMSLTDVAERAHISVATLSRVERDKQTLELGLFLSLMRILEMDPAELLGAEERGDGPLEGLDPLVARITSLAAAERAHLWRTLASRTATHERHRRNATQDIALQVEELLAQLDYLRNEVEVVRKRLRKKQ
jgi:transcriptional regulator with XRE-family HTH domain